MKLLRGTLSTLVVLAASGAIFAQEVVPMGHRDFYPSAERPVGFRGDGSGAFPGATPVTQWWEGTPQEKKAEFRDKWGRMKLEPYWDIAGTGGRNIVWKTPMPGMGNTQPIVVGDRVFTTAEPDLLICADAHTGKVLWVRENNIWEIRGGLGSEKAAAVREMYNIAQDAVPQFWAMTKSSTMSHIMGPDELGKIVETFRGKPLERIVAALKSLDSETDWDAVARTNLQALDAYLAELRKDPKAKIKTDKALFALKDTILKRVDQLGGLKMGRNDPPWYHLVGWNMATPCSDGRFVYYEGGMGAMACYDLEGNRVWARYFEPDIGGSRMGHAQSPLLAGDVVVSMHGNTVLRGLDKKTGQTLWEAPTKGDHAFGKGGGYYVGSHAATRLSDGQRSEWFIVTTMCNVIRARDGKVAAALPFDSGPSGGPSMAVVDGVVIKSACGDNYGSPMVGFELTLDGEAVKVKKLWEIGGKACPGYHGQIYTPQYAFFTGEPGHVVEMRTGKVLVKAQRGRGPGGLSNTLAGKLWIWADEGNRGNNSSWGGRRDIDYKALGIFGLADLSDPTAPKQLPHTNVLGGADDVQVPTMQKYAPELYAMKDYYGNSYGKPAHFLHTGSAIFPQGNRLFIRTAGFLYCIGDPSVKYDWNPASRDR